MNVARDVLAADHEPQILAGVESHACRSQRDFNLHDFAFRQLLVTVKTLNGNNIGRQSLVEMATADAQTAVGTRVFCHTAVVLQHVVCTGRGGTILVVPPDSVFEVEMMDDSFDLQFVSFKDLPADVTFNSCIELQLTNDDMELTGEYFHLLYHTVNRQPLSMQSTRALLTGMLNELHALHERTTVNTQKTPSRQQEILQRFITLLNRHAAKEHNISFYADRLCLTPNHLGATICEASGLTAMQWIHRYIIQQAKLQLLYSDHPVWQISETLNFPNPSFFSKFFKRETGMTPAEYRQMK